MNSSVQTVSWCTAVRILSINALFSIYIIFQLGGIIVGSPDQGAEDIFHLLTSVLFLLMSF